MERPSESVMSRNADNQGAVVIDGETDRECNEPDDNEGALDLAMDPGWRPTEREHYKDKLLQAC